MLLETEWVLRAVYGFAPRDVVLALRAFAGLRGVSLEAAPRVAQALDWAERGMDFADALRLTVAQEHDGMVSFDRALARLARRVGAPDVVEP